MKEWTVKVHIYCLSINNNVHYVYIMYISLCSALVLFFSFFVFVNFLLKVAVAVLAPFTVWSANLICHPSTYLSVYPSVCPSICLCSCLSVHLSVHPPVWQSPCLSVHVTTWLLSIVTLTVRPSGVVYLPTNSPSAFSGVSAKETGEGAENRFHFKLLTKRGMSFTLWSVSSSRFHRVGALACNGLVPEHFLLVFSLNPKTRNTRETEDT